MNIWTEHRNPEGRTYWFNTGTRESVWEKPDELKTPFERALNQTKWKEYFSGGRKYYYNTETKESKWDMPDELLLVLEKVEKEGQATAVVPAGQPTLTAPPASEPNGSQPQPNGNELAVGAHTGGLPLASSSILPARPNLPDDPVIPHNGFATLEEGEKAFTHLLRKAGVDANWTWDQTMRAIITDPLYKALNSLAEKKSVFEKYTTSLKVKEKEEREARLAKLRPAIRNMLKGNPSVFHYTTFATADKLFSQHPIWQQARIEAERKLIFEEYIQDLKQRDTQDRSAARTRATAKVVSLFKQLDVDVLTRWRTAHNLILDSDEWKSDSELQKLPSLDILLAFEDYSRVREREYEEQMRRAQVEKTRKERKAREAFKALLRELVDSGKIKARCKWKQVYPLFSTDERYLNMLGNPGSNQLELFWDVVDGLDQKLDAKIDVVAEAFKEHRLEGVEGDSEASGFVVGPETTEEQYQNVLKAVGNANVETLTSQDIHDIYTALHDNAIRKQAEEKRKAEKRQRHLQDDLRYALKKLPEQLDITLSYEAVVPFIEHLPEYKALDDEESRRSAFAKFVKRQKERLREAAGSEDGGSTTSRKRKESARDGDREHDRDRDRDRERERDRDREPAYRERDRNRERGKDYDRDNRRHHYRHDDYDARRSSREYTRADRDEKDRERDGYRPRHQREEKDDRRRDRDRDRDRERSSRPDYGPNYNDAPPRKEERDEVPPKEEPREKRDAPDDRLPDDRAEKRPRYDREESVGKKTADTRAETPEEGEI